MSNRQNRKPLEREPYLLRQKPGKRDLTSSQPNIGAAHKPASRITEESTRPTPIDYTMASDGESVNRTEFLESINKIIEKLDSVNLNVTSMRGEIAEIRKTLVDVETAAADTAARLTTIENVTLPKMEEKRKESESELRELILAMEIHDRKMNLLMYGVAKSKDECVADVVRKSFEEIGFTHEEAQDVLIAHTHRLPRRPPQHVEGEEQRVPTPDPIIVRFALMRDRDAVLLAYQKSQKPETTRNQGTPRPARPACRIVTDLPAKLKKERFLLEKEAYQIRRNEQKSTRIRLVGTKLRLESREKGSAMAWRQVVN